MVGELLKVGAGMVVIGTGIIVVIVASVFVVGLTIVGMSSLVVNSLGSKAKTA